MKNKVSMFIVLLLAGGFHAIAEDTPSSTTETSEVSAEPKAAETHTTPQEPLAKKPKKDHRSNIFFGGYISLSFGDYSVIGIEPMVGYRINPKLSAGLKVRYEYIQDDRYGMDRTTSNYGGSIFARYYVTPKFYAQLEPAIYSQELFYVGGGSEREQIPYLFAGGGVKQPLGERSWLFAELMFDILQSDKSPYDDWEPFLSIGVGAGF